MVGQTFRRRRNTLPGPGVSMKRSQIPHRVASRHLALTSTAAAIAAAVPLLLGSSLALGETRGYVISWFATATNNPEWTVNCPGAAKDPKNRDFPEHNNPDEFGDKAVVKGK